MNSQKDLKVQLVKMGTKVAVSRIPQVREYNIIMDVLGGWSRDLDVTTQELVGSRRNKVLQNMQKAMLSGSLNISRTLKVAT